MTPLLSHRLGQKLTIPVSSEAGFRRVRGGRTLTGDGDQGTIFHWGDDRDQRGRD